MKDQIFQLKVNGKSFDKVRVKEVTANLKAELIAYVKKTEHGFDETKDILEIENITPPETNKVVRHSARDKSVNNKYVDAILDRHLKNLIATYGEERLLKMLANVHGLVKTTPVHNEEQKTKAN